MAIWLSYLSWVLCLPIYSKKLRMRDPANCSAAQILWFVKKNYSFFLSFFFILLGCKEVSIADSHLWLIYFFRFMLISRPHRDPGLLYTLVLLTLFLQRRCYSAVLHALSICVFKLLFELLLLFVFVVVYVGWLGRQIVDC